MPTHPLPKDREPTLRLVPMPADANAAGDIFGGWIMSQVDIAGSIAAMRRAQGRVVTVAVNAFQFRMPVFVGDLVSCYAKVTRVGTTSLTVDVEVYAERGLGHARDPEKCVKVTEATLTYVAIDDRGRKRPLPPEARA
jgi:acyl-CoA thioesterase YciA